MEEFLKYPIKSQVDVIKFSTQEAKDEFYPKNVIMSEKLNKFIFDMEKLMRDNNVAEFKIRLSEHTLLSNLSPNGGRTF